MKIFNYIKKSKIIHIVDNEFKYIKKNVKLKKIPIIGEKIYFNVGAIYVVYDIIHYIGDHQTIWVVVDEQLEELESE